MNRLGLVRLLHCGMSAFITLVALSALAQESPYQPGPGLYPRFTAKDAEPGTTYGSVPDLPLPKTVLFSVTPQELIDDAAAWKELGIEAFFITGVASEWSVDVWGSDGEPWTIGAADKNFQLVKQAAEQCRALGQETFLTMAFSHTFDWFDDLAWQKIENNFRQFALFARESGCTGIAIDVEYIAQQYHFNWEGYDYQGYTREDLVEKMRARGTQIARALYDAFPDAPLLTFPESSFSLGSWLQAAWIEEAARRKAPGGVHLCTEYTYRRPNLRFMFGHAWMNNDLMERRLSKKGMRYWQQQCSIAEGLWPFGVDPDDYHGAAPTPEEFRQAFAASLMVSPRYNWIYSHDARPRMLGRDSSPLEAQAPMSEYLPIIQAREVATNDVYVRLARELRALELRDFAPELGLMIVPTLAGPREELEVGLMPAAIYANSLISSIRDRLWKSGEQIYRGKMVNLHERFGTQTDWLLIGPYANVDRTGRTTAYPHEISLDPDPAIPLSHGTTRWKFFRAAPDAMSVNLAEVFQPSEQVCAYAKCFLETDQAVDAQIRVGANDNWKLWLGGKLVFEDADDGRIILDRDIVPVSIPAGRTPLLLKVCNNKKDWGFVLRITNEDGGPVQGLRVTLPGK